MLRHSKIVWAPVSARLLQATIEFSKRWPLNGVVYKGEMWKYLGQRVLLLPVHPLVHNTGFIFLKSSAGFWQYGTLQWDEFYRYIIAFVLTKTGWTNFQYDTTQQQYGAPCQWSTEIVQPGHYISYSPMVRTIAPSWCHFNSASGGKPIPIFVLSAVPRPRNPTISDTPAHVSQSSTLWNLWVRLIPTLTGASIPYSRMGKRWTMSYYRLADANLQSPQGCLYISPRAWHEGQ